MEEKIEQRKGTGVIKIVIIGPESTGKSTLCAQLAEEFNTIWVKEYARQYLLEKGTNYKFEDLRTIAEGQLVLEENAISELNKQSPRHELPLFIDTNMYVMQVWSEFVFDKCDPWILEQIVNRSYDMYLLCNTDLQWTKDELREYPDLESRQKLFNIYKQIMSTQQVPWVEIGGEHEQRFETAAAAIKKLFPIFS